MFFKRFFPVISALIVLSGCAAFQIKQLPSDDEVIPFEPLKLDMSFDAYTVRLDIHRQTYTTTKTSTDAKGRVTTTSETHNVPYHYIGVDLGNGIFLDARLNLSINLVKFLDLEKLDYFKVSQKISGMFGSETIFEKDGNKVTTKQLGLFGPETHVTLRENGALIKGGFLESDQDIIMSENQIFYDPHTIFGDWTVTKIEKTPGGYRIPGFWQNFEMMHNTDGSVSLGDNLIIFRDGKKIIIEFAGIFGFKKRFTFLRTEKNFYYFDENNYGFMADLYEDRIIVKYAFQEILYSISRERETE